MNRRKLFKTTGAAIAAATIAPKIAFSKTNKNNMAAFRYCLNTSTIRDCEPKPALKDQISIAAEAGYDGIEIWVRDVAAYLEAGNSAAEQIGRAHV